jgi:hypothetical protein
LVYIAIMYGTGALIRPIVKKHSAVEFYGYAFSKAVVAAISLLVLTHIYLQWVPSIAVSVLCILGFFAPKVLISG